jgi:hypothetical protein
MKISKIGLNLNFKIWGIFSKIGQNHDKSAKNLNLLFNISIYRMRAAVVVVAHRGSEADKAAAAAAAPAAHSGCRLVH